MTVSSGNFVGMGHNPATQEFAGEDTRPFYSIRPSTGRHERSSRASLSAVPSRRRWDAIPSRKRAPMRLRRMQTAVHPPNYCGSQQQPAWAIHSGTYTWACSKDHGFQRIVLPIASCVRAALTTTAVQWIICGAIHFLSTVSGPKTTMRSKRAKPINEKFDDRRCVQVNDRKFWRDAQTIEIAVGATLDRCGMSVALNLRELPFFMAHFPTST